MPETTSGAILRGGSAALRRSARGPGISLSDIEEIAGIRVFQGVPKRELSELARMASITRFPADAVVLREGDPADDALLVVSGRLRASVRAGHRVRKLGSVRPGEVIGEGALFTGRSRRNATVTALRRLLLSSLVQQQTAGNDRLRALLAGIRKREDRRKQRRPTPSKPAPDVTDPGQLVGTETEVDLMDLAGVAAGWRVDTDGVDDLKLTEDEEMRRSRMRRKR